MDRPNDDKVLRPLSEEEVEAYMDEAVTDVFPTASGQDPKTEELPFVEVEEWHGKSDGESGTGETNVVEGELLEGEVVEELEPDTDESNIVEDEPLEGVATDTEPDTDESSIVEGEPLEGVATDTDQKEMETAVMVTLSGEYEPTLDPREQRFPGRERDGESSIGIQDTSPQTEAYVDTSIGRFASDFEADGNETGNNDPAGPTIERFSEHLSNFDSKDGNQLNSESIALGNMLLYIMDNGNEALERLNKTIANHIDAISNNIAKLKRLRRFLIMVSASATSTLDSRIRSKHEEFKLVSLQEAGNITSEIQEIKSRIKDFNRILGISKIEEIIEGKEPPDTKTEPDLPPTKNVTKLSRVPRTDEGGIPTGIPIQEDSVPVGKPPESNARFENSMEIAIAEIEKRDREEVLNKWIYRIKMKVGTEYNGQILSILSPGRIKKTLKSLIDEFITAEPNRESKIMIEALESVKKMMRTDKEKKAFDSAIDSIHDEKPSWIRRHIRGLATAAIMLVGGTIGAVKGYEKYYGENGKKSALESTLDLENLKEIDEPTEKLGKSEINLDSVESLFAKYTPDFSKLKFPGSDSTESAEAESVKPDEADEAEPVKPDEADEAEPVKPDKEEQIKVSADSLKSLVAKYTPNVKKFKFPGAGVSSKPAEGESDTYKTITVKDGQRMFDIVGDKDSKGLYDEWKVDELKTSNPKLKNLDRWDMGVIIAIYNGKNNLYTYKGNSLEIPTWKKMVAIYTGEAYEEQFKRIMGNYRGTDYSMDIPVLGTDYSMDIPALGTDYSMDIPALGTDYSMDIPALGTPNRNNPESAEISDNPDLLFVSGTSNEVNLEESLFDWKDKGIDIEKALGGAKTEKKLEKKLEKPAPEKASGPFELITKNNDEIKDIIPVLGQSNQQTKPKTVEDEWEAMLSDFNKSDKDSFWDLKI